jgi:hypothetical protein
LSRILESIITAVPGEQLPATDPKGMCGIAINENQERADLFPVTECSAL